VHDFVLSCAVTNSPALALAAMEIVADPTSVHVVPFAGTYPVKVTALPPARP